MKSLERRSLSEQISADLRRQILVGEFPPESRLPAERSLAKQYGTNRNTLREAIRNLVGLGLVRVRQGDGVIVRDFHAEGELALLRPFLAEGGSDVERTRLLLDLLRMRRVVLAEAATLAAQRATDEDIAVLRSCAARLAETAEERTDLIERDLDFYKNLIEATHSLVVRWAYNTFSRVFHEGESLVAELWVTPERHAETTAQLVSCIAQHQPEKARAVLDDHLAAIDVTLTAMLAERRTARGTK